LREGPPQPYRPQENRRAPLATRTERRRKPYARRPRPFLTSLRVSHEIEAGAPAASRERRLSEQPRPPGDASVKCAATKSMQNNGGSFLIINLRTQLANRNDGRFYLSSETEFDHEEITGHRIGDVLCSWLNLSVGPRSRRRSWRSRGWRSRGWRRWGWRWWCRWWGRWR
jgi:hypothetical protein